MVCVVTSAGLRNPWGLIQVCTVPQPVRWLSKVVWPLNGDQKRLHPLEVEASLSGFFLTRGWRKASRVLLKASYHLTGSLGHCNALFASIKSQTAAPKHSHTLPNTLDFSANPRMRGERRFGRCPVTVYKIIVLFCGGLFLKPHNLMGQTDATMQRGNCGS